MRSWCQNKSLQATKGLCSPHVCVSGFVLCAVVLQLQEHRTWVNVSEMGTGSVSCLAARTMSFFSLQCSTNVSPLFFCLFEGVWKENESSRWVQSWQSRRRDKSLHSHHWPDTTHAAIAYTGRAQIRSDTDFPNNWSNAAETRHDGKILWTSLFAWFTVQQKACFCCKCFYYSVGYYRNSSAPCVTNRFTVRLSSWGGIYISESEKWQPLSLFYFKNYSQNWESLISVANLHKPSTFQV